MERTLAILKPDCIEAGLIGKVLDQILSGGFKILAMKMVHLTPETAGEFYAVHRGKYFYPELTNFMSSGQCVPVVLEKVNAVTDFRTLIGATDPAEAAEGTVRKNFAESKGRNIVHGSDSIENAKTEISFFFSEKEIVENI